MLTEVLCRSRPSFVLGNYNPISLHFTWHSNLQLGCHKKCLGFWFSDETCDIASVREKWRSVKLSFVHSQPDRKKNLSSAEICRYMLTVKHKSHGYEVLGWFYHDWDWLSWSEHGADDTKPVSLIPLWATHFRVGLVIFVGPFQLKVFYDSVTTEGRRKVWKALSTLRKGLLLCFIFSVYGDECQFTSWKSWCFLGCSSRCQILTLMES